MFTWDNFLDFRDGPSLDVGFNGFSTPENGFIWQVGRFGEVIFDFESPSRCGTPEAELIVELDAYCGAPREAGQNVLVYLNGYRLGSVLLTRSRVLLRRFDWHLLRRKGNVLTLDAPDAARPTSPGTQDTRVLGARLLSLQFRPAPPDPRAG
ncbi:hypothetical protein [Roseomonas sp. AR75]|uniref:hypothetical protein n=1 Tax=Roseomonas sp. AR75 TaxID=2562311 RepID=UPI0010C0CFB6|nr:hypothetical protein [Roseomonas sp. AR75]